MQEILIEELLSQIQVGLGEAQTRISDMSGEKRNVGSKKCIASLYSDHRQITEIEERVTASGREVLGDMEPKGVSHAVYDIEQCTNGKGVGNCFVAYPCHAHRCDIVFAKLVWR